jgi:hypothetical protein
VAARSAWEFAQIDNVAPVCPAGSSLEWKWRKLQRNCDFDKNRVGPGPKIAIFLVCKAAGNAQPQAKDSNSKAISHCLNFQGLQS